MTRHKGVSHVTTDSVCLSVSHVTMFLSVCDAPQRCSGNGQFEQQACRREVGGFDACGGTVRLELEWRQNDHWYMLQGSEHSRSRADVIVWCVHVNLSALHFSRAFFEVCSGTRSHPIPPPSEATSRMGARASTTAHAGEPPAPHEKSARKIGNGFGAESVSGC